MRNWPCLHRAGLLIAIVVNVAAAQVFAAESAAENADEIGITAGCETLDACMDAFVAYGLAREERRGVDRRVRVLVERIVALSGADEALVGLLVHENERVAGLAGYALADTKQIDPRHLPAIEAGLDRGLGWLPPALARIGTDEAAALAVARALQSDSFPENQEGYAIELLGAKALAPVIAAARCETRCPAPEQFWRLAELLAKIGPAAGAATPELLQMAGDPNASQEQVVGLIRMIGGIGAAARPWQQELAALAGERAELTPAVEAALIAVGADAAGLPLAERLRRTRERGLIVEIAELGAVAQAAAPALLEVLDGEDWQMRFSATRALGYLGEAAVAPALQQMLFDPRDVRANWAAAESLGMLRAQSARADLLKASEFHWHPGVRIAAQRALILLDDEAAVLAQLNRWTFFSMADDRAFVCADLDIEAIDESSDRKRYIDLHPELLAALAYTATNVGYAVPEMAEADADGIVSVTSDQLIRQETHFQTLPDVALRLAGGWMAGTNRGEWVGELMWLGDNGERYEVMRENVQDIYQLGDRVIALTGIAHLMMNDGVVFELVRDRATGRWTRHPWRILPGAPKASWLNSDGLLQVATVGHGTFLLDQNGQMSMVECASNGAPTDSVD